ncbi:hypothetical protein FisN_28Lu117 [Fistulifera solaris]|uniref:Uncharacterized protein n=1 Tax=Fistulifera solaris TaxID=1519565 RepID=A0A1Z5K5Z5_FISSO|nr:hypothetical protein FisN_28Lu117 [Fistulifera solaris]|eukprot:GAX21378.1 hypothetical protein FisN_28Lu117 [Fistulifera solaris]
MRNTTLQPHCVQEGISMHLTKLRGSPEVTIRRAYHRTRATKEHPTAEISLAPSRRSMQPKSFETVKTLASERASAYDIDDEDSESGSSLEDSFLSLGKANNSAHSSTSFGMSFSEINERCRSPTKEVKRDRLQSSLVLSNSLDDINWTCSRQSDPTPSSEIGSPRFSSVDATHQYETPVAVPKLYVPPRKVPSSSNPFFSLPFTSPPKKSGTVHHFVSPKTPNLITRPSSRPVVCSSAEKQRDLPSRTVKRSPETPDVPLFLSPNKSPIEYRRLQPKASPPAAVLGLYDRQRVEQDDRKDLDDDDDMSDITCSPAEPTRQQLSDGRWKSELVVSASQLSLANMPQRYSSPARER